MRLAVGILTLACIAACAADSDHDIVGPFTGPTTRFAIDHITLPADPDAALQVADDLDGDGNSDNELGIATAAIAHAGYLTSHGDDMIGGGVIASSIVLQANDLERATRAGATYFGADGDTATTMGGDIVAGVFASNRTRTTHVPGEATLVLPVFVNADPTTIELDAMELDLSPDGSGGYNALVRGEVAPANALAAVATGMIQMIASDPADHVVLARDLDANRDGKISPDEIMQCPLIGALVGGDLPVSDNQRMSSLGFAAHLVPCTAGGCAAPPSNPCFDRLRDGDETDVDCGGSCGPCAAGGSCEAAADCQLGACDAGVCPGPSCSDGLRDGLETDVDCGWNCAPCASGKRCVVPADCASGVCDGAPSGRCM